MRTAAGHLNDQHATIYDSLLFDSNDLIIGSLAPTGATVDASGGWWDAGDYLKFVQTHSYTVALMLIGMRKCPPAGGDLFKKFDAGGAIYKDDQQSYSTVEPAIDLTASSFLMFSWRIARSPATLIPSADFSSALDQTIVSKPNPQWPERRNNASRFRRRNTVIPAPN